MFKRLISIVVALGLASVGFGQEKAKDSADKKDAAKKEAANQERQHNEAAKAILQRRLPEVKFDNTSFRDAIDFLRDVTGANIYSNWREMKKVEVDEQTKINLAVKDVTLEKVLNLLVTDAGGKESKLAWMLDDGVIQIDSAERIRGLIYIRIYEVADLLDARVAQRKGDVLMSIITECIAPSSWADSGGKGAIKFRDGKLVITQTAENHQAIMNLLDGLREFRK